MTRTAALDVLIDWSAAGLSLPVEMEAVPEHLSDELEWACIDVHVHMVPPPGAPARWARRPGLTLDIAKEGPAVLDRCMRLAQRDPKQLLVCAGTALPGADVIGRLQRTLLTDAMFGAAAPRLSVEPSGDLVPLGLVGGTPDLVPRARLADLDELYIFPERLFPCMLLRGEVLANLDPPAGRFLSLGAALVDVLWSARRRGFRIAVDNRAVVSVDGPERATPPPIATEDEAILATRREEEGLVELLTRPNQGTQLERLLAAAGPACEGETGRALLDCTGMQDMFNGTSLSVLGLLDGFHRLNDPRWSITVMALPRAERFFSLTSRYPLFRFVGPEDDSRHAVALRLSQVWDLATWMALHQRALSIAVSQLDSIGIDILYTVRPGITEAFQFTGEHTDGLLYISEFSRGQFRRRFRVAPGVREIVHYLSLDPRDHVEPGEHPPRDDFLLVVGNEYDHKDVLPTVLLLGEAFPFLEIRALGLEESPLSNVEALPSGSLPADLVERLYATARGMVYPSFYEGFGLPMVKALAHGRPVFARRSPLLTEIAGLLPPDGRLVPFSTRLELVEAVGGELHGRPAGEMPLGSALAPGAAPLSWTRIAQRLCDFMEHLVAVPDSSRWRRRDDALRGVAQMRQA